MDRAEIATKLELVEKNANVLMEYNLIPYS